jgi:hypothetical protein
MGMSEQARARRDDASREYSPVPSTIIQHPDRLRWYGAQSLTLTGFDDCKLYESRYKTWAGYRSL